MQIIVNSNANMSETNGHILYTDLKNIPYNQAWNIQKRLFQENTEAKIAQRPTSQQLLVCEHPHVYTLGKSGNAQNLLITNQFLHSIDAEFVKIDRGGDITYHGPGQLVGYPIFDLDKFHIGVKQYVNKIEDVIIQTVAHFNIQAARLHNAPGVWVDANKPYARKIAAIGIKTSRGITMHGFALNVNTQLHYFEHINPCGFTDKGATSIQNELNKPVSIDEVKSVVKQSFAKVFGVGVSDQPPTKQSNNVDVHHGKNMEN